MDRSRGIILWVAGFSGVLLIYSAYKNRHPLEVISSTIGATASSGAASVQPDSTASVTTQTASDTLLTASSDGYVYDANGNVVGDIPNVYSKNPQSYVPSATHG